MEIPRQSGKAGKKAVTDCKVLVNNKPYKVKVLEKGANTFLVEVNKKTALVRIKNPSQATTTIEINSRSYRARIDRTKRNRLRVEINGKPFEVQSQPKIGKETVRKKDFKARNSRRLPSSSAIEKDAVTAPIAGRVVLLKADIGQKVEKGDCICILEAMKMENEIVAPKAGVVSKIMVSEGTIVNKGDILVAIK